MSIDHQLFPTRASTYQSYGLNSVFRITTQLTAIKQIFVYLSPIFFYTAGNEYNFPRYTSKFWTWSLLNAWCTVVITLHTTFSLGWTVRFPALSWTCTCSCSGLLFSTVTSASVGVTTNDSGGPVNSFGTKYSSGSRLKLLPCRAILFLQLDSQWLTQPQWISKGSGVFNIWLTLF